MTDELESGTAGDKQQASGENIADAEVKVWKVWDLPGLIAIGLYLLAVWLAVVAAGALGLVNLRAARFLRRPLRRGLRRRQLPAASNAHRHPRSGRSARLHF